MEGKTRCIVLRTVKYGDNKVIADLLCREYGRQSVLISLGGCRGGMRRSGNGRGGVLRQLFQPLSVLEVDISMIPRQTLARLNDVHAAVVYSTLPFDGAKLSLAFFVAEFLSFSTRDLHSDSMLYDFVERSLVWLDTAESGIANFHLTFMLHMSRFLGFYPAMDSFTSGSVFDLREGRFTCTIPSHRDFLPPEDAERFLTLMRMTPANAHLFRLTRAERNRITDLCLHFYRLHIPGFGEMKTLEVLRAL